MKRLRFLWRLLNEMTGDADYERYCRHLRRRHPERKVPTASEFYLSRLEEKYTRPNRCC